MSVPTPSFYGVTTTGIVCGMGCPSRAPKPGNVLYFTRLRDARDAGLRPCNRCRPDHDMAPGQAFQRFITQQLELLAANRPGATITELVAGFPLSRRQIEKLVQAETTLSPARYIASVRLDV